MTKNFCDLCGEPADSSYPTASIKLDDKSWSGYKSGPSASGCDGRWTPEFAIIPMFRSENLKEHPYEKTPDLCRACKAKLVKLLLDKLSA